MKHVISHHADRRIRQRGIRNEALVLLLGEYDTELFAGAGCISVSLSRIAAAGLIAEGHAAPVVEAAKRLVAVVREDNRTVVTVHHGLRGRRYRHQFETRKGRQTAIAA